MNAKDAAKLPAGTIIQNHKGEYGMVWKETWGAVVIRLTKEQAEQLIATPLTEREIPLR